MFLLSLEQGDGAFPEGDSAPARRAMRRRRFRDAGGPVRGPEGLPRPLGEARKGQWFPLFGTQFLQNFCFPHLTFFLMSKIGVYFCYFLVQLFLVLVFLIFV